MSAALCEGLWRLFDSTDLADHEQAARLCAVCPLIDGCRERLAGARAAQRRHDHTFYSGPVGTWAGQLVGGGHRNAATLAAEEELFTADELRKAHRRYAAGDREPRTEMGERVYQRQTARRRRQRATTTTKGTAA